MRHASAAALALLLAACAHGPSVKERKTAEIHNDLGVDALRNGRPQEALKEFDIALQSDPEMPEANLGRGLVLEYGFGKLAEAEHAYRRALQERPSYSEAHNNLGQLLARQGRYDEAVRAFDAALDNMDYREPFIARCNKGQALWRSGRRDEGLAELKSCTALTPRYCQGRREFGRLLLGDGKVKEALEELQAYVRFCDGQADAHYQLGLGLMKAGRLDEAKAQFERCEELGKAATLGDECRKSRELLQ